MIFVCVGSREYQFNRLLMEIDLLIENKIINENVFAQIGQSDYVPKNYEYKRFLSNEEFSEMQANAKLIISHGGTGALISALKKGKKVISVPRQAKYQEHIDDHQLQVSSVLDREGYLKQVLNIEKLGDCINICLSKYSFRKFESKSSIIELIIDFLNNNL